jgi:hypothetical protein
LADKLNNAINPAPVMIAPPIKGNPAPARSGKEAEKRNGTQKNIPATPTAIAIRDLYFTRRIISITFTAVQVDINLLLTATDLRCNKRESPGRQT